MGLFTLDNCCVIESKSHLPMDIFFRSVFKDTLKNLQVLKLCKIRFPLSLLTTDLITIHNLTTVKPRTSEISKEFIKCRFLSLPLVKCRMLQIFRFLFE